MTLLVPDRLLAEFDRLTCFEALTGCLLWLGPTNTQGYGRFTAARLVIQARARDVGPGGGAERTT